MMGPALVPSRVKMVVSVKVCKSTLANLLALVLSLVPMQRALDRSEMEAVSELVLARLWKLTLAITLVSARNVAGV